jgi:hypothetical protein
MLPYVALFLIPPFHALIVHIESIFVTNPNSVIFVSIEEGASHWVWRCTPVIPALGKLRQEDLELG